MSLPRYRIGPDLTMGQSAALTLLRGRGAWATADELRVKARTLEALQKKGLVERRYRRFAGVVEWNASATATSENATIEEKAA